MWATDLRRYRLLPSNTVQPADAILALQSGLDLARRDRPSVLNLSIDVATETEAVVGTRQKTQMLSALRALLDSSPATLLVSVIQNAGSIRPFTLQDYAGQLGAPAMGAAIQLLKLENTSYTQRIIMVGSLGRDGKWLRQSGFVLGGTDILAPAEDVAVLGLPGAVQPLYRGDVVLGQGVSFGAPMVSGVAAQLWSMDPSLSAEDVKRYILRGAFQPRIDSATGSVRSAESLQVDDAPEPIYALDAYGALTLLGRERPNTPICGSPVTSTFVTGPDGPTVSLRIARAAGLEPEIYRGPVANVTVAQGGRRIGIEEYVAFDTIDSRDLTFAGGSWSVGTATSFRGWRQFLEVDTAFVVLLNPLGIGRPGIMIRGSTARGPYDPCPSLPVPPRGRDTCSIGTVSPTGEWVHTLSALDNYDVTSCGANFSFYGSYLTRLSSSPTHHLLYYDDWDPCGTPPTDYPLRAIVAWHGSGTSAWATQAFGFAGPPRTELTRVRTLTGAQNLESKNLNSRIVSALVWQTEGSSLLAWEDLGPFLGAGPCDRSLRASADPTRRNSDSTQTLSTCFEIIPDPQPANLRATSSPRHVAAAARDLAPGVFGIRNGTWLRVRPRAAVAAN